MILVVLCLSSFLFQHLYSHESSTQIICNWVMCFGKCFGTKQIKMKFPIHFQVFCLGPNLFWSPKNTLHTQLHMSQPLYTLFVFWGAYFCLSSYSQKVNEAEYFFIGTTILICYDRKSILWQSSCWWKRSSTASKIPIMPNQ